MKGAGTEDQDSCDFKVCKVPPRRIPRLVNSQCSTQLVVDQAEDSEVCQLAQGELSEEEADLHS